jgi:hypothetical protein
LKKNKAFKAFGEEHSSFLITFFLSFSYLHYIEFSHQSSKMIIFESILTTFEPSSIFKAAGTVAKFGMSLKLNQHKQIELA